MVSVERNPDQVPSLRSPEELRERRGAWRRRRRRRRVGFVAGVAVIVLGGALALALAGKGQGQAHHAHLASRSLSVKAPRPTAASASASAFAAALDTSRHILSYTSYIALGTPRKREIALTFDDGPGPYTLRVLRVLERLHVKATFFEIGRQVREYPRVTARLVKAGMVIGDHTEEHPPMALLDASQQARELDQAASAIRAAGAPRPLLFRPPYGSFDATTLQLLRERSMVMVLWAVDTSDYTLPGVQRITHTALSGAQPGAIILLHDGGGDRSETVAALPRIIGRLLRRGYKLVSVPQLLRDDPPPVGQPPPVNLSGD